MILSNLSLVYQSTIKIIVFIILSIISTHISAQNPVLEFAKISGDNNPDGSGPVLLTTINFVNNSNNSSGNTFINYSSPSTLSVTATLSEQQYDLNQLASPYGCAFIGYSTSTRSIYPLMDAYGDPSKG